jgi:hypothetical protein
MRCITQDLAMELLVLPGLPADEQMAVSRHDELAK